MNTYIQESTLYPDLVQYLIEQGFDAIGETKFKDTNTRPDILFTYKGEKFVIEVKLDDTKVALDATAQAARYARKLGTNNFIVLIFPKKIKNQTLFGSKELKNTILNTEIYVFLATDKWSENIPKITFIDFVTKLKNKLIEEKPTVDFESIVDRINDYVTDFNGALNLVNSEKLASEIVEKLDLFASIGDFKDKESALKQVVNLASFLLFNQIFFYHVFHKRTKNRVSEILEIEQTKDLQKYFNEIQQIDYKSIYKVNILGHIPNIPQFIKKINDLILGIKSLGAEHITHDLAGRFFHELIPHEVRKVLAAFYTHPNAADLLAGLLIGSYDDTIIDPSCGSGTLLVAGYKRKQFLYEKIFGFANQANMHKDFIEKEITGIDIMPFAAHISTINLTMQNIEEVTNIVRFATRDSLQLAKPFDKGTNTKAIEDFGIDIEAYTETIQGTMFKIYEQKAIKQGAINPEGISIGFKLTLSDVVIMNPPYSDREKMPKIMQDKLNENITLNKHCGNLINLWGYFLVLGDLLVKENGLVGSVIPINFARGQASEKIRDFTLKNHTIRYIIKPVGDIAFSEGAAFRDILLITQKKLPQDADTCKIVYFKKSIKTFQNEEMPKVYQMLDNAENESNDIFDVFTITHKDLKEKQANLMHFLWANSLKSYQVIDDFYKKMNKNKLINFPKNFVREGFSSSPKGMREITFITNPMNEKSRIERAFMILENKTQTYLNIRLGKTDLKYKVPFSVVTRGIRTLTSVNKIEISDVHDYVICQNFEDFKDILNISKFKDKQSFNWDMIKKKIKYVNLVLAFRFNIFSKNTHFISFYSEKDLIGADAFKIIPNVTLENAKILSMFFNSIVNICQIMSNQQGTTGEYGAIRENDLLNFQLLNYEKLTEKEKEKLLLVFDSIRNMEFPSIVEQIETRFAGRLSLDMAILEVLGYSKSEINKILPDLYEVVLRELKQDF